MAFLLIRNRGLVLNAPRRGWRSWLAAFLTVFLIIAFADHSRCQRDGSRPLRDILPKDETYSWQRVAIGGGGFITGYGSDPTGVTRVARADVHGAYLWLSEQDRWAQLATSTNMPEVFRVQDGVNEGVYEITTAPSQANRIFMAVKGRVFRSDDRGGTFIEAAGGLPTDLRFHPNSESSKAGPFLAVSPIKPDLVFPGTPEHGLWRSLDAGSSWARVESVPAAKADPTTLDQPPSGIMIWFERGPGGATGRIWALSSEHGIYISNDSGVNFAPLVREDDEQPRCLIQGVFAPDGNFYGVDRTGQRVWRYRDNSWSDFAAQGKLSLSSFTTIAVNPRTLQIFVFDQGGQAYRSSNGGESWMPLLHRSMPGANDPPWLHVSNQSYFAMGQVMFDPIVPDRLWAGTGTGVYYSDVPSLLPLITWVSQSRGIEELVATDVAQGVGQAPLFASLDFGVHRKDDLFSFSKTYGPKERVLIAVQQLALTPSTPAFIATNASDTRINCCSEDGDAVLAAYSTDGGNRWRKFDMLPTPRGTRADDPWRMSFGSIAVSAGSPDNIVWEPTFNRTPHYTIDRGRTWSPIKFEGRSLAPGSHTERFLPRKTLAADGMRAGVFYLAYAPMPAQVADLTGLWRSENGGKTWQHVFNIEIAPSSQYAAKLRAVPGRIGDLFFTSAVSGDGDRRLRRSRNGGISWQVIETVEHVDDLAFGKAAPGSTQPTIFLSGRVANRYGIWRSIDDGTSWMKIAQHPAGSLDQVTVMAADPDRFGRVYVGYMGSGFIVDESQECRPVPYYFQNKSECFKTTSTHSGAL